MKKLEYKDKRLKFENNWLTKSLEGLEIDLEVEFDNIKAEAFVTVYFRLE
ncbi:hypothetical protein GTQ40_15910 [Flavobacteriaceae bacterium R38]|nr:hypothetical protein [Flavobacteriaceae bacterium R38]